MSDQQKLELFKELFTTSYDVAYSNTELTLNELLNQLTEKLKNCYKYFN